MTFETLLIESPSTGVGLIRLNRPHQYNALNTKLLQELAMALEQYEQDDAVSVVIITGSEKAFAAGADISEMVGKSSQEMLELMQSAPGWTAISTFSKPTICSVAGMALGGGFELALQCDILLAAEGAQFALPEITLGVIPGAGGTQRVARLVGKSLAMEMVLNARPILAEEALSRGIVSQVIKPEQLEAKTIELANRIAQRAPAAVKAGKNCVNKAILNTLEEGLDFEKKSFLPLFDTDDAKQMMSAFLNKSKK